MALREFIREDLVLVTPQDALGAVCRRLEAQRVGSALVVDEGTLVGILTERDVVRAMAEGADGERSSAADYMTRTPMTIEDDRSMEEAARVMMTNLIRHLPVIDRNSQVLGMLSIRDIVRWTVRQGSPDETDPLPRLVDLV